MDKGLLFRSFGPLGIVGKFTWLTLLNVLALLVVAAAVLVGDMELARENRHAESVARVERLANLSRLLGDQVGRGTMTREQANAMLLEQAQEEPVVIVYDAAAGERLTSAVLPTPETSAEILQRVADFASTHAESGVPGTLPEIVGAALRDPTTGWILATGIDQKVFGERFFMAMKRTLIGLVLGIPLLIYISRAIARTVIKPVLKASAVAEALARDETQHELFPKFSDECGNLLRSLDKMQRRIDERIRHKDRELATMARVSQALECTSTCVMIANEDMEIVFANRSVNEMLRLAESDLRQALPEFAANKIIGGSIDQFHRNPEHQRTMLQKLTKPYSTRLTIGPRHFTLVASPVDLADGRRVGYVVEWKDISAEVVVESEVTALVANAAQGRFDQRIDSAGMKGFVLNLSNGLNELLERMTQGINETKRVVSAIASGDLEQRMTGDYQGFFLEMKQDVNACAERLSDLVSSMKESAESVTTSASEIAEGNNDLSARTEQQAASLEETASSMEQLTQTVKQNAESARQANQLAQGASEVTGRGGAVVKDVVKTMQDIDTASRRIEDIIGVIDGIAFQTNILALNAAVEAARAGEQGRGFAVVATEVRSLAQRCASASREIKTLINDSVGKVAAGGQLVAQAGQTMEEIQASIQKVTGIVGQIANASEEQRLGIEQVNMAITQMDQSTQQNAALVEEASAAARSMLEQASVLNSKVQEFNVGTASEKVRRAA